MNIIILGATGQVGGMLIDELQAYSKYSVQSVGRTAADLIWDDGSLNTLDELLSSQEVDVLINAIAYTAVDKAESEQEQAFVLNSDLPARLADICQRMDALLVHYSTDFVFDGLKDEPWLEWDETNPLSVYGKSKLAGEKAIQMTQASAVILRTSWVYGETGNNFVKTMIRLGKERETLGVVADQAGCPTYSRDIAKATIAIIERYENDPTQFNHIQTLCHLSGTGSTTWYGFAEAIFAGAAEYERLVLNTLNAITTADYPTPAIRPANSVLNCDKLKTDFDISMPDWKTSLAECLERLYQS